MTVLQCYKPKKIKVFRSAVNHRKVSVCELSATDLTLFLRILGDWMGSRHVTYTEGQLREVFNN